ncbi:MAG: FKBP-type peptidyl-prolyl cis-trans isomerase [Bacteroidota bacterium]
MNCKIILLFTIVFVAGCAASKFRQSPSGLQYRIIKKGSGPKATTGQEILLLETTTYRDGTVLYSNEKTGKPVKVKIGANQATLAVDEALLGMKEGEIKEIIAAPHLVKRKFYPSNVHPDSTLFIRLVLYKIEQ